MRNSYFVFKVKGKGRFPVDMLRYDQCHPVHPEDTANIENSHDTTCDRRVTRTVTLSSSKALQFATEGRWASFGWHVEYMDMPTGEPS